MIFHRIRQRFGTAGLVVAVIGLVLALGGGAYAASGALTAKQKKEVKKIAQQFAGAPGAPGAPGAVGPAGPQGPQGGTGAQGQEGTQGKSVVVGAATKSQCSSGGKTIEVEGSGVKNPVCNGAAGKDGQTGFTDTLPSGKTETGAWLINAGDATENPEAFSTELRDAISFPIPLPNELDASQVHFVEIIDSTWKEVFLNTENMQTELVVPTKCPGSEKAPAAAPGHLCLYANTLAGLQLFSNFSIYPMETTEESGASTAGARLRAFQGEETSRPFGFGTFAVTAP